ncbi:MAG: ribulokinase [Oscillospiraceae bacterium]|nr:ribulokinase [Oscillospiraceae bacterium]
MGKYTMGIDFGTLSGRCVVVDCRDGRELAEAVCAYPHGVMDTQLPGGKMLPAHYALQHPEDYMLVLKTAVQEAIAKAGISPEEVAGLGIDFTSCTILPVDSQGTPLCLHPEYADEPHAYVKLWKHHAAQAEADEINALATARGEEWLAAYGGKVSSEWVLPKVLQILREAPGVYGDTARFMEAADWVVSALIGEEIHGNSFAGYKALYYKDDYPSNDFMTALDGGLDGIIGTKLSRKVVDVSAAAGVLCEKGAMLTGLPVGIAVAVPQIDAHAAMPALQITDAGELMLIMGTSSCHIVNSKAGDNIKGVCGWVKDGVIPGLYTYEAGQAAVGDVFDWFVKNQTPAAYKEEADRRGISLHTLLTEKAERLAVGENGLIALDWFNGNRSVLDDSELSGLILGLTLRTKPEDIYRALLEATAFGTRMIVDTFEKNGVPIAGVKVAGGIAHKNPLLMQIYADVLNREMQVCQSTQAGALGSAIYAAAAAGIYLTVREAAAAMGAPVVKRYTPSRENHWAYQKLYEEYVLLHDYFGKGGNGVMKRLLGK